MRTSENAFIFRPVNKDDVDELYSMFSGLTEKTKRFFHPHLFDRETITRICTPDNDHYFVMMVHNAIVGYSMLRLFGYTIPSFGCCIRNGYWGKGYGTRLTVWTLNKAKELGYKKVILNVYKENTIAFKTYKKVGFTITGENKDTDEIRMEIML